MSYYEVLTAKELYLVKANALDEVYNNFSKIYNDGFVICSVRKNELSNFETDENYPIKKIIDKVATNVFIKCNLKGDREYVG